jgi:hypothetical protein
MKNIVSTALAIYLLLTMGSTLANAQNDSTNTTFATQRDLHQVQSQQRVIRQQVTTLKNDIGAVKAGQDKLASGLSDVKGQIAEQDATMQAMGDSQKFLGKSVAETQKDTSDLTTKWILSCVALIVFAFAFSGGAWLLLRKIRKDRAELEESNRATVEALQQRMKEIQLAAAEKGVTYVFESVIGLRKIARELLDKTPGIDPRIPFTYRVSPDPQKGLVNGGEVSGYVAVFNGNDPIEKQFPRVYYKDDPTTLRLDKLPKHAAGILGLLKESDAAKPDPIPAAPTSDGNLIEGMNFGNIDFIKNGSIN